MVFSAVDHFFLLNEVWRWQRVVKLLFLGNFVVFLQRMGKGQWAALSLVGYRTCPRRRRYRGLQAGTAKTTIVELESCSSHGGCEEAGRSRQHSATPSRRQKEEFPGEWATLLVNQSPWVCRNWAWRQGPACKDTVGKVRGVWESSLFQFCPALLILKEK